MIPFASQRAGGQDLATHLSNEEDNELVEIGEFRGCIANDLHGAFAEWEAQAHLLTKCENYLYSLSVNPDHRQGEFTDEQYYDYLDRVEEKLGLSNQPRVPVFHIKDGRKHCHVIYSRIDAQNGKAIHMAFDHDKLMSVTRQFAQDHGLELPEGYHKNNSKGQLLLHEKNQQETTGITKQERMAVITELWQQSDNAHAFVAGLKDHGYELCRGKRPYVLIDYYGHINALPRLIESKEVRSKDVIAFLEKDFPSDGLADVEEIKKQIDEYRKNNERLEKDQAQKEKQEQLKTFHEQRRADLNLQTTQLQSKHETQTQLLSEQNFQSRSLLRADYLEQKKTIQQEREEKKPTGLALFLAKASGFLFLQQKMYRRDDRSRYQDYVAEKQALLERQRQEEAQQQMTQEVQRLDLDRQQRAISLVEKRELNSLQKEAVRKQRIILRKGEVHSPSLELALSPPGRKPQIHKAKNRYTTTFKATDNKPIRPKPRFNTESLENEEERFNTRDHSNDHDNDKGRSR